MRTLIGACLAALATAAAAHDPLPDAQWCSTGHVVEAGAFAFDAAAIGAYVDCLDHGGCIDPVLAGVCSLRSCGNFDDDYGKTTRLVHSYCHEAEQPHDLTAGSDYGTVRPIVYGPLQFLRRSHHDDYRTAQGVHGVCARCDLAQNEAPSN
ncbi:hypothetical protein [Tahibacter caeni]|uniref:hypothetical protein n=1 Tax=Tahibacter caeni TaxID=1453545 RepID=UPI0021495058|nr:hypothetical protein [Tahibacter caeni]